MSKPAKIVLCILDGLGDTTHELHGKHGTCLQLGDHPTLDAIAKTGKTGLMDSVSPGLPCGSDTAHLSLFGYPPFKYYNGRGAFEALGGGMPMIPGDIAFKSNFSTIYGDIVKYRRCDRHFEVEGPKLCHDLDGIKIPEFPEVDVSIVYATEHRCAVRIRAPGMSDRITGTDPIHDNKPLETSVPLDDTKEAIYTSKIVNALSNTLRKALENHPINKERVAEGKEPANVILLRGPGMRLNVTPFDQLHNIKSFLIAPTAIIAGLGISVGLPIIKVEGATGDMDSNYEAKAIAAAKELDGDKYDMGIIHMKGIDDASHDGKYEVKAQLIERADKAIHTLVEKLSEIEERTGDRFIIGIIADHTTSSTWLDHTFEPIPVCFAETAQVAAELGIKHKHYEDRLIPADNIPRYEETTAGHGSLGRFCGAKLMKLLFHFARRTQSL
ncbi:Metalloenzyme superfamily protein [Tritrichomonas foetus]|uniref:Metalloenzyme superfamily protein n=1 Tax=Tritrichomonas foetus TaxID=1144522 RepID=A0A1J4K5S1_9EUKA|nr:Metalloenzyme superfamily protein [Tritrichomonas foetus]|eukprot:OHT06751.1 Metalloenzyme superfamily protein [Tritrichomonas foetus]